MRLNFDTCLKLVLEHEGGFVDHPSDPGGMTNLGITRAVYEKHIQREASEEDMRGLTFQDVRPIYRKSYWNSLRCDDLPLGVDYSVFDFGVNAGVSRSAKTLQKIVGAKQDGVIGTRTLEAVGKIDVYVLLNELKEERQAFYESLNHFTVFGKGWTRRNQATFNQAIEMIVV
jgi:lysozyme family protein